MPSKYIRFELVDFNCKALSKIVPGRHQDGKVFLYSGALGGASNAEALTIPTEIGSAGFPNAELVPDWDTMQCLPWASNEKREVFRVYCEIAKIPSMLSSSGLNDAVPRTLCQKQLTRLRDMFGLQILAASELEFTVCKPVAGGYEPYFRGVDIFATLQNAKAQDLMYEIEESMCEVGIDIRTMNAEYGEGQLEITFAPSRGIKAADQAATFRTGVKEICQKNGLLASFFTRPFGVEGVGNGGHFNFSLWQGETGAMHSPTAENGLSVTAQRFLAGVLAHAPALEALCAPTPACYTRHGNWAPTKADWGIENRLRCVRVKSSQTSAPENCYMELRLPSASANPYLILAGLAAAGTDGIARKLELPAENDPTAAEIPTTLEDALEAFASDAYMVDSLGEVFFRWYRDVKKAEIDLVEKKMSEGLDTSSAWQYTFLQFI